MNAHLHSDGHLMAFIPFILVSLLLVGTAQVTLETSIGTARFALETSIRRTPNWANILSCIILPATSRSTGNENGAHQRNFLLNAISEGTWVMEMDVNDPRPLYTDDSCPYFIRHVTCQRNGRPDSLCQMWSWKPHSCDMPRFNAMKLSGRPRDKRLIFIGDSIQRTEWKSMVQAAIPYNKKCLHKVAPRKIFVAEEFNASIEFYWAPFLVESNADHATKHQVQKRLLKLDSIAKHSRNWEGVNVLVFESYVWWMSQPRINARIGSQDIQECDVPTAYRLSLQTWAKWIESTTNPETHKVFFMNLSPTHLWSWAWKPGGHGNCFKETYPIPGAFWGAGSSLHIMGAVGDALQGVKKVKTTLLNITQLSEFRRRTHNRLHGEARHAPD